MMERTGSHKAPNVRQAGGDWMRKSQAPHIHSSRYLFYSQRDDSLLHLDGSMRHRIVFETQVII